jgi:dTMP kinase
MRSARGLFIVFEGGDAVGKTTQVDLLCELLASRHLDVVRTFEPGDTALGSRIRQMVLDPATGDLSPRAETLLYAADKAHHLSAVVQPALARGAVVVCDRYVDSLLAYQGAGRVLAVEEVERIARWATHDLRPHLTIVLDADPLEAVHEKLDKDRVEAADGEFHGRARRCFLELAELDPEHYLVVGARGTRAEVAAQIAARVDPLLSVHQATLAS